MFPTSTFEGEMDIYGVIGWPIEHSLSPVMHNAAFEESGIDAEYRKFPVKPEGLEYFLLNRKDVVGFNITVPHKIKAKEMLYDAADSFNTENELHYVELCGAVNTVKRDGDELRYANTDVMGFLTSLEKDLKFNHTNKNILLLGCGGAGRAVIAGLGYGNASSRKIYIYDNNDNVMKSAEDFFSQFSYLKDKLEFISNKKIHEVIKNCQLLVNASSMGMEEKGDTSLIDKELLHKGLSVFDLVYNRETRLIKDARSLGLSVIGGLGMLLYQGAHAFEFWTERSAPVEVMREALLKAISCKF